MTKKRMYVTPECVAYMLPSGMLCQNNSIKLGGSNPEDKVSNSTDIGFSKGFSGGVEDDEPSSSTSLWGEE
jgi:hypothetical protein